MLDADVDELLALSPVCREELTTKISAATPKRTPMVVRLQKQLRAEHHSPLVCQSRRESLPIFDQMKKGSGLLDLGETSFLLPGCLGSSDVSPLSLVSTSQGGGHSLSSSHSPLNINTDTTVLSPITPAQSLDAQPVRRALRTTPAQSKNSSPFAAGGKHSLTPLTLPAPTASPFEIFADTPDSRAVRSAAPRHSPMSAADYAENQTPDSRAPTKSKRKAPKSTPLFRIAADPVEPVAASTAEVSAEPAPRLDEPPKENLPAAQGKPAPPSQEARRPLSDRASRLDEPKPDVLRNIFAKARRLTMASNNDLAL